MQPGSSKASRPLSSVCYALALQTDTLVPGVGNHSQLQRKPYEHESRVAGLDWPDLGLTMVRADLCSQANSTAPQPAFL